MSDMDSFKSLFSVRSLRYGLPFTRKSLTNTFSVYFALMSRIPGQSAGFSRKQMPQPRERSHTHGSLLPYPAQMEPTFLPTCMPQTEVDTAQRTHRVQ